MQFQQLPIFTHTNTRAVNFQIHHHENENTKMVTWAEVEAKEPGDTACYVVLLKLPLARPLK